MPVVAMSASSPCSLLRPPLCPPADACVAALAVALPQLATLNLQGCSRLGDDAIGHLVTMPHLRWAGLLLGRCWAGCPRKEAAAWPVVHAILCSRRWCPSEAAPCLHVQAHPAARGRHRCLHVHASRDARWAAAAATAAALLNPACSLCCMSAVPAAHLGPLGVLAVRPHRPHLQGRAAGRGMPSQQGLHTHPPPVLLPLACSPGASCAARLPPRHHCRHLRAAAAAQPEARCHLQVPAHQPRKLGRPEGRAGAGAARS